MTTNRYPLEIGWTATAALLLVIVVPPSYAAEANPLAAAPNAVITFESLLHEMANRDALARWPVPSYACRQASSWDRGSVAPDKPGWFANVDTGKYLRTETNQGRQESVMLDAEGPGCIVRWWAGGTTPQMGPPGTIRIYLDGAETPAFEGLMDTLVSPEWLVGPPLGDIRCIGRNLYLPIPYAKHCKITYDRPPLDEMRNAANRHWYVINYRTYCREPRCVHLPSRICRRRSRCLLVSASDC